MRKAVNNMFTAFSLREEMSLCTDEAALGHIEPARKRRDAALDEFDKCRQARKCCAFAGLPA
jgi:hypothetical protein